MYINDIRKQEYEDWGIYSINISGVKSVKYGGYRTLRIDETPAKMVLFVENVFNRVEI